TPHPELVYDVGKSYDGAGDAARALAHYRQYLSLVSEGSFYELATQRAPLLASQVGVLVLRPSATSTVQLDGALMASGIRGSTELEINAGRHTLEVASPGYSAWRQTIEVRGGERLTVEPKLAAAPRVMERVVVRVPVTQRRSRTATVLLAVSGAALAVVA